MGRGLQNCRDWHCIHFPKKTSSARITLQALKGRHISARRWIPSNNQNENDFENEYGKRMMSYTYSFSFTFSFYKSPSLTLPRKKWEGDCRIAETGIAYIFQKKLHPHPLHSKPWKGGIYQRGGEAPRIIRMKTILRTSMGNAWCHIHTRFHSWSRFALPPLKRNSISLTNKQVLITNYELTITNWQLRINN